MPYIKPQDRECCDKLIEQCQDLLKNYGIDKRKGIANYIISRIIAGGMIPDEGWSYTSLSNAISVFKDAEYEMRRRLLDRYEDVCIDRNGDILEYKPGYTWRL